VLAAILAGAAFFVVRLLLFASDYYYTLKLGRLSSAYPQQHLRSSFHVVLALIFFSITHSPLFMDWVFGFINQSLNRSGVSVTSYPLPPFPPATPSSFIEYSTFSAFRVLPDSLLPYSLLERQANAHNPPPSTFLPPGDL